MKKLIFISIIYFSFSTCASSQVEEGSTQKHYFYFDKTHPKMEVYGNKRELRHLYRLTYSDPVIFIPYDSIEKEIKIKNKKNYKIKDYNWLNKLNNTDVGKFFYRSKGKKEFYLIEKRESNKVLYLRRVTFIQEYE